MIKLNDVQLFIYGDTEAQYADGRWKPEAFYVLLFLITLFLNVKEKNKELEMNVEEGV